MGSKQSLKTAWLQILVRMEVTILILLISLMKMRNVRSRFERSANVVLWRRQRLRFERERGLILCKLRPKLRPKQQNRNPLWRYCWKTGNCAVSISWILTVHVCISLGTGVARLEMKRKMREKPGMEKQTTPKIYNLHWLMYIIMYVIIYDYDIDEIIHTGKPLHKS